MAGEGAVRRVPASKQVYVDRLRRGEAETNTDRRYLKQMKVVGDDRCRYGLDVNGAASRRWCSTLSSRGSIPKKLGLDELFIDI